MPEKEVLALLLGMVDETSPTLPKAHRVASDDLVHEAGADEQRIDLALAELERQGVVRRCAGRGSEERDTWSLYHDYLAPAVLSAHSGVDRWQHMLKERLWALDEATDWRSRWRALLSPWEQLRLIPPTLRRKVHWGGYGGFALLSTARLLPMLAGLGLVLISVHQALDWQAQQEAERILTAIRSGGLRSMREHEK